MVSWKNKRGNAFGREVPEEKTEQMTYSLSSGSKKKSERPPQKNFSRKATAPYNFVSLPKRVLPAQITNIDEYKKHVDKAENLSGEIELEITARTPLFIGVGDNNPKSFSPVGKPIIPGSSLRGMFKNIFKIVTCGTFCGQTASQKKGEDFNDEHIYFRCLMASSGSPAWMGDLCDHYKELMTDKATGKKKARPGFLIYTDENEYFIVPYPRKTGCILIKDYQAEHGLVRFRDSRIQWAGTVAYCLTGNQFAREPEKLLNKTDYEAYKKELAAIHAKREAGLMTDEQHQKAIQAINHGKQIIRFMQLEYVDWDKEHWLKVPDEVLSSYKNDRNRSSVDLLDEKNPGLLTRKKAEQRLKKNIPTDIATLIPCHYIKTGEQVTAFGHGQFFRMPYKYPVSNAVKIENNDALDFADMVFGKKEFWASRVYFEDAIPSEKISELKTAEAHPLMQPNPTSYQLYLKQDDGKLKHWDSEGAQIRGYKLYWHNDERDYWLANDFELRENQRRLKNNQEPLTKKITPLAKGAKFKAKIRFKNLSAEELGALMMIFTLDNLQDAAYKIGQGKPFGFGSVKITPTLLIEDETAYTELFGADGWKSPYREENPDKYLYAFRKYITEKNMSEVWQDVMDELKIILDWSKTKRNRWSDKIKQMSGQIKKKPNGNETLELDKLFINRAPLQKISEVLE